MTNIEQFCKDVESTLEAYPELTKCTDAYAVYENGKNIQCCILGAAVIHHKGIETDIMRDVTCSNFLDQTYPNVDSHTFTLIAEENDQTNLSLKQLVDWVRKFWVG